MALQTKHGHQLAEFKKRLVSEIGVEKIQLVTISRPSAYGEYEHISLLIRSKNLNKRLKSCEMADS